MKNFLPIILLGSILVGCDLNPDRDEPLSKRQAQEAYNTGYIKGYKEAIEYARNTINYNLLIHRDLCLFYQYTPTIVQGAAGVNCDLDFSQVPDDVALSPTDFFKEASIALVLFVILLVFIFFMVRAVVPHIMRFSADVAANVAASSAPVRRRIISEAVSEANQEVANLRNLIKTQKAELADLTLRVSRNKAELDRLNESLVERKIYADALTADLEKAQRALKDKNDAQALKEALESLNKRT